MLHPVGTLPASVYWRRRMMLLGAVVVLAVLSAVVLNSGSGKPQGAPNAGTHTSTSNAALHTTALSTPSTHTTTSAASTHAVTGATTSPTGTAGVPATCTSSQLKVVAVAGQTHFQVGDHPQLLLQVTNTGTTPCVQDLADSQVELRVYNGESRVWGSHDCQIEPGKNDQTLLVGQPVRVSIIWSGLSSQPKCAGTRQRVGAGTYTLYALLSGHTGTAAQFSIS